MGYNLRIASPNFAMVGGGKSVSAEPDRDLIMAIRRQFEESYDALMEASRTHGYRVSKVTYGVCVDDWPILVLTEEDYGSLRTGLNALERVLS